MKNYVKTIFIKGENRCRHCGEKAKKIYENHGRDEYFVCDCDRSKKFRQVCDEFLKLEKQFNTLNTNCKKIEEYILEEKIERLQKSFDKRIWED